MQEGSKCAWSPESGENEVANHNERQVELAVRFRIGSLFEEQGDVELYSLWRRICERLWRTYTPLTQPERRLLKDLIDSGFWPNQPIKDYWANARTSRS